MSALQPLANPISAVLPSDAFQLLPEARKAGAAEDALYEQQLKEVEAWWASPRYEGIKRPYSAADVVSKRGSQMQSYPSSVMARKLFNLIKEREAKGEPIHTSMLTRASYKRKLLTLFQWVQLTQCK
jgi:isocitrate lyase